MNNYYVYILQCDDGSYYTGVTNDIERRLEEHTLGIKENAYTSWNDDLKVVYMEEFHDINDAIAREKQIK
jgi:putative endonuclease